LRLLRGALGLALNRQASLNRSLKCTPGLPRTGLGLGRLLLAFARDRLGAHRFDVPTDDTRDKYDRALGRLRAQQLATLRALDLLGRKRFCTLQPIAERMALILGHPKFVDHLLHRSERAVEPLVRRWLLSDSAPRAG
jgi:hypothetical protein